MKKIENCFEDMDFSSIEEREKILYEDESLKITIIFSYDQSTQWYDQKEHEIVTLLRGEAVLEGEKGEIFLQPGDVVDLPPRTCHRVKSQKEAIWYCVWKKI